VLTFEHTREFIAGDLGAFNRSSQHLQLGKVPAFPNARSHHLPSGHKACAPTLLLVNGVPFAPPH
jgi:hypothetical protein